MEYNTQISDFLFLHQQETVVAFMGQGLLPVHQILALRKGLDTRLLCARWREEAVSLLGECLHDPQPTADQIV